VIDHRKIQRVLFLMQLSPACARSVFDEPGETADAFGLGASELALLRGLDPVAVSADRDGKRADQLLGNTTSEYLLTVALGVRRAEAFLDGFLDHATFREAILGNTPLPLAFGGYAQGFARERGDLTLLELVRLELAMARARRTPRQVARPAAGEITLTAEAHLIELVDGTVAHAAALRAAIDAGTENEATTPALPLDMETLAEETLAEVTREEALLVVRRRPRHGLPDVDVERLEPLVAALLRAAREPLNGAGRDAFAAERELQRADLDAFVDELVDEGVLMRGT